MTIYKSDAVTAGIMPDHASIGSVLNRTGTYAATGDIAADDTIQLVPIPKNARILNLFLDFTSNSSSGAFDLGDGSSTGRFINGVNASGVYFTLYDANAVQSGRNYTYTADDTIDITLSGSDLSSGATVELNVFYTMEGSIEDEE